jgi:hypothetical protein
VRVSVVVPTYRTPPEALEGLVASLDAQTMPDSDFEVLFVDDGSGDDTVALLEEVARTRQHVRVQAEPHTGWPGHPRNVGLDLARGEFVVFMDHDDQLYPGALEGAYAFAARSGADVVTAKESRTDQARWGLDVFTGNLDDAVGRDGPHPLLPTNPHKLFRRQFLVDHAIRFPEGRRVLWEDVFFNVDIAAHGPKVGILSDVPFYHWVRGRTTASSSYGKDPLEFWRGVLDIVRAIDGQLGRLDAEGRRLHYEPLLLHQLRSRVLAPVGPGFFDRPSDVRTAVEPLIHEILTLIPTSLDERLPRPWRARSYLMRAGRWDLVEALVRVDVGIRSIATTDDVSWESGVLRIRSTTRWRTADGSPVGLVRRGTSVHRVLPSAVEKALPAALLDVTDDVFSAASDVAVRERTSAVTWLLPTETSVSLEDLGQDRVDVVATSVAHLDTTTVAMGHPLDGPTWDASMRTDLWGVANQRPLGTRSKPRVALVDGRSMIAYRNKQGALTLDLDQALRSVVGSAPPQAAQARVTSRRRGRTVTLDLTLPGIHVEGDAVVEGDAYLLPVQPAPAKLVAEGGTATLRTVAQLLPGEYRLVTRFGGRETRTELTVVVDRRGRATVREAGPTSGPPAP